MAKKQREVTPHIFALAETAYVNMLELDRDQRASLVLRAGRWTGPAAGCVAGSRRRDGGCFPTEPPTPRARGRRASRAVWICRGRLLGA